MDVWINGKNMVLKPTMSPPNPIHSRATVLKQHFPTGPQDSEEFCVHGIGIRELMHPCLVDRPLGTGDYLLMVFHDPVMLGRSPTRKKLEKPDTMMVWPPGKAQYYGNPSQRFSHTWIRCAGKRLPLMLRLAKLPVLTPFRVADPFGFQQCLLDVHRELISYVRPDDVLIANLLENCIREISRKMIGAAQRVRIPENLQAVRRLIASVPTRTITLDEMASVAGISVSYFSARFKTAFGLSPMECLILHRLHRAAHLLSDRNLRISEIAAQTGYQDEFHFSKMFKKHFGISPREMRKRPAHPVVPLDHDR